MKRPAWWVPLRFENIVAFALGKSQAWGLYRFLPINDNWDEVHITCWNFLPFQLQHAGQAPKWVVYLTLVLWLLTVVALIATLAGLWKLYRDDVDEAREVSQGVSRA